MQENLRPHPWQFAKPSERLALELEKRQRYVAYTHERNYACRITESDFRELRCVMLESQLILLSVGWAMTTACLNIRHSRSSLKKLQRLSGVSVRMCCLV